MSWVVVEKGELTVGWPAGDGVLVRKGQVRYWASVEKSFYSEFSRILTLILQAGRNY